MSWLEVLGLIVLAVLAIRLALPLLVLGLGCLVVFFALLAKVVSSRGPSR